MQRHTPLLTLDYPGNVANYEVDSARYLALGVAKPSGLIFLYMLVEKHGSVGSSCFERLLSLLYVVPAISRLFRSSGGHSAPWLHTTPLRGLGLKLSHCNLSTVMTSDLAEELSLLSISEDLVPSTDETPSQEVILAFDGLLCPPLVLQTNETECGGKLWPAGIVLAEYLLRNKMDEIVGKKMFVRSIVSLLLTSTTLRVSGYANQSPWIELSSALAAALWGMLSVILFLSHI